MKTLYLILTVVICVSIILFVAAFFYIDTHRRTTLTYNVYEDDVIISSVTLNRYNTEDYIVYKSTTETPFHSVTDTYKRKLSIDKKTSRVHEYNRKSLGKGVNMNIYIKPVDSSINYLAVGHSNFAYAKRLPVNKEFTVFEPDAIITYFDLINKYDFKEGGTQLIPVITPLYTFLTPYKSQLDVRFIKEEIISINSKKMKTQHFRIKTDANKKILVWVNRWTQAPLLVKIPRDKLRISWSDKRKKVTAKKLKFESDSYQDKEISFENKDIILSGTLSIPNGKGPFPAIILLWGHGPQNRDALGMFSKMADSFARNGVAVLRFDKRGIGESGGDFSRFTGKDLLSDAEKAIDFLSSQKEIDKDKITLLGHSEGGYIAASLAATNPNVSACIIMAGMDTIDLPDTDLEMMWSFDQSALNWNKEYLEDIARSANDTSQILKSGKDWAILLNKRVYLKKRRNYIATNPLEIIRKVKVPILILGAKKDTVTSPEHIDSLEEALKESGNKNYEIVIFKKLNHFFGSIIRDGVHRTHISLDRDVFPTIKKWLDENIISPPLPEPPPLIPSVPDLAAESEQPIAEKILEKPSNAVTSSEKDQASSAKEIKKVSKKIDKNTPEDEPAVTPSTKGKGGL